MKPNQKKMNTRQQFKKAVIEAIHGKPYKEAIKEELVSISTKGIKEWAADKKNTTRSSHCVTKKSGL